MPEESLEEKVQRLRENLRGLGGVAVAFSGGVDSTFLLAMAVEELGRNVLAVTARSPIYSEREQEEARELAKRLGARQVLVDTRQLELPEFVANPPDRCYVCKASLCRVLREVAEQHGMAEVADGTNADDSKDYRPGGRAVAEYGVRSPLLEAGLTKEEIRELSRRMGLPTASKPAFACLASRIPYGSQITETKLKAIDTLETALQKLGFTQFRARHHGDLVRIEVLPQELAKLCTDPCRNDVVRAAEQAGFRHVTADLKGYRMGSLNESLIEKTPG